MTARKSLQKPKAPSSCTAVNRVGKTPSIPTSAPLPTPDRNVLKIFGDPDPAKREQQMANITAEGMLTNAILMQGFSKPTAGEVGITEAMNALRANIEQVNRGDTLPAEIVLYSQAQALNSIFAEMARRASLNMGEHIEAFETYMRLALKAQGQCRATLETLSAIKNPPVVFAKQANIANGPQQVNNGPAAAPCVAPRVEESKKAPIELLDAAAVPETAVAQRREAKHGRT